MGALGSIVAELMHVACRLLHMTSETFQVTVKIASNWVDFFRDKKIKLCSSFSLKTNISSTRYNVIATAEDPTPITAIAWTDHYRIAASSTGAEFGSMVYNNTEPKTISAGQLFVLEKNWTSTSPNISSSAPEKGFLFANMPSASAVLFKTVRNKKTPIYVTATGSGTPPPGKHSLTPTGEILLFFMTQDSQTAFDVNLVNSEAYELLYIEQPNATVLFNKDGHWEFINHVGEDGTSESVPSTLPHSKL